MASEILAVPEESLAEVIKIIRAGIKATKVSAGTKRSLLEWCKEEEEYLKEMSQED